MTGTGALEIEELTVAHGARRVLCGLTVRPIHPGSLTALVGPNAAGKSTLLRTIAGFLPARGTVRLGGEDLLTMARERRAGRVGFMPQAIPTGAGLTVFESIIAALKAAPLGGDGRTMAAIRGRASAVLESLGIVALGALPLGTLSGGQRQLVSLAQSVARQPDLLLLDEPTSALDLRHQFRVMEQVRRIAGEGRIVVAVMHDLAVAARWADRIVVLHEGGCAADGAPDEVLTPALLARVYGVAARVEPCSHGRLGVVVDGLVPHHAGDDEDHAPAR